MFVCVHFVMSVFFFFKQKTAYEMRISDWSSDVCSSDLIKRYALDAEGLVLDRVSLRAGDDIRLSAPQPQFESASVLLTGEFARPGLYTVRKGETDRKSTRLNSSH